MMIFPSLPRLPHFLSAALLLFSAGCLTYVTAEPEEPAAGVEAEAAPEPVQAAPPPAPAEPVPPRETAAPADEKQYYRLEDLFSAARRVRSFTSLSLIRFTWQGLPFKRATSSSA